MTSVISVEEEGEEKDEISTFECGLIWGANGLYEECEVEGRDNGSVRLFVGDGVGGAGGKIHSGGGSSGGRSDDGDNGEESSEFWDPNRGSYSTDVYYQKLIAENPGNSLLLSNYAKFLKEHVEKIQVLSKWELLVLKSSNDILWEDKQFQLVNGRTPGMITSIIQALETFFDQFDQDFISIRTKAREVLQREDDLNEIVLLVGKDALAEQDKITLETTKLLREDYLVQNAFTPYDKFCPFYKSVWMMRNIIHFYNLANQAVEKAAGMDGQKTTYSLIKHGLGDLFYRLVSQKFEDPAEGEPALVAKFKKLHEDLTAGFCALEDETR